MIVNGKKLKETIEKELAELKVHLPIRIYVLLDEFTSKEMSQENEIDLFNLLVKLILKADSEPALIIANLLVTLDTEESVLLDERTISNSGAFLRDHLKKDQILYILKTKNRKNSFSKNNDQENDSENEGISERKNTKED